MALTETHESQVQRFQRIGDHPAESWYGPHGGQVHSVATYLLPHTGTLEAFHGRSGYYVIDTDKDEVLVWKPTLEAAQVYLDEVAAMRER